MSLTEDVIQHLHKDDVSTMSNPYMDQIGFIRQLALRYKPNEKKIDFEKVYDTVVNGNNPRAYRFLGNMYLCGAYGLEKNVEKGLYLLQTACELGIKQGKIVSTYMLANIYMDGDNGVGVDRKKSIYYAQLGVQKGDENDRKVLFHWMGFHAIDTFDYFMERKAQLEEQVKELEETVKVQEKETIELRHRILELNTGNTCVGVSIKGTMKMFDYFKQSVRNSYKHSISVFKNADWLPIYKRNVYDTTSVNFYIMSMDGMEILVDSFIKETVQLEKRVKELEEKMEEQKETIKQFEEEIVELKYRPCRYLR